MKKALILSGLLLVLSASLAIAAPGLHLSWDDCGANGSVDRGAAAPFSCNTNSNASGRANVLVASYIAPAGVSTLAANEAVLDYQMAGGSLPTWWNFTDANCISLGVGRAGQLLFAFRSGTSCTDWPGSASVSGNMTVDNSAGPDRSRLALIGAYTSGDPQPLTADTEYNSFALTINNAGTLGTGCPGCATPGCFVLNQIILNTFPETIPQVILTNPGPNGNHVTWRGGTGLNCPGATPSQKSSWGQLKSLYR